MAPRPPGPRPLGPRLGPPPQLGGAKVPVVHQQFMKVQPKLQEVASRHAKLVARWMHEQFSWRQFLMGWMVLLIASKMVLLALTFPYFTLTSLVSLQVGQASDWGSIPKGSPSIRGTVKRVPGNSETVIQI